MNILICADSSTDTKPNHTIGSNFTKLPSNKNKSYQVSELPNYQVPNFLVSDFLSFLVSEFLIFHKLELWQKWKKIKLWQNSKTQIVKNSETQIGTKLNIPDKKINKYIYIYIYLANSFMVITTQHLDYQ